MGVKNCGIPIVWACKRSLTDIGFVTTAASNENPIHVPFKPRAAIVVATALQTEELVVSREETELTTKPTTPAGHRSGNQYGIEYTWISISLTTMKRVQQHTCGVIDRGMRPIDVSNTLGNVEWKLRSFMAPAAAFVRQSRHSLIIDRASRCPLGHQLPSQRLPRKRVQKN
jgi:hypothetical protein